MRQRPTRAVASDRKPPEEVAMRRRALLAATGVAALAGCGGGPKPDAGPTEDDDKIIALTV
jgi:hypothetical protein